MVAYMFDDNENTKPWSAKAIGQYIIAFLIGVAFGTFLYFGDKLF